MWNLIVDLSAILISISLLTISLTFASLLFVSLSFLIPRTRKAAELITASELGQEWHEWGNGCTRMLSPVLDSRIR
jgi:hypothetical protein